MESPVVREPSKSKHMKGNLSERLKQSIQLLDNSVSGSNSILRTTKTPRSYTPRYVQNAPFDVSSYLGSPSKLDFSALDLNFTYTSVTKDRKKKLHELNNDITVSTASLLEKADPGVSATVRIYDEFLTALRENQGENQVFELLDTFIRLCNEKLETLKNLISKLPTNQSKCRQTIGLKLALQCEVNTWELIRMLYHDRLLVDNALDMDFAFTNALGKRSSEKQFVEILYERDATLRQSQLVVGWLENIASKEMEDNSYDRFEFFSNKGFSWEKTLSILEQRKKQPRESFSDREIISELDPDAQTRQKKPLADLDKENELSFLKCLFSYVRTGQLNKAEQLCEHYGQMWRSATLQGWRLFHDPNYERLDLDGKAQNLEGNPYRDIWKSTCWAVSEEDCLNPYERAIYASLSGNLKSILPVCYTWEEYLWAYYRVMIDTKVEMELRSNFTPMRYPEELPSAYWDQLLTPEAIFQELKASSNDVIQQGSREPFHLIQKYIILDDIEGLIEEMHDHIEHRGETDHHFVRFAAHLILVLRTIGRTTKEEFCVSILEAYVKVLISQRQMELVPSYTATLPQLHQVSWYARFLEGVSDRNERQLCLRLAEEAGLDVPLITKTVVENIRSRNDEMLLNDEMLQSVITTEDQEKIDAMDWLVFDPLQRAEAMRQANALMRYFLAAHKLDATRAVFTKLPPDSIDTILRQWQMQTAMTELPAVDDNATREYLCLQAYLQAQDAFSDWFEHFHHGKPESPALPSGATFAERVAYEHKEAQYKANLDRWQHTLDLQTKISIGKMYNVLLFVDGGWMVDQRQEDVPDEHRRIQMERLRELCLPQIILLLHSVLHSTGQFKEAIQLAAIVSSERHQLYKVFRKQELHRLLIEVRKSSLRLLDQNLDPLGYPLK